MYADDALAVMEKLANNHVFISKDKDDSKLEIEYMNVPIYKGAIPVKASVVKVSKDDYVVKLSVFGWFTYIISDADKVEIVGCNRS